MGHALFLQLIMPKILSTQKSHPAADIRITLTSSIAARQFSPKDGLALSQMKSPAAEMHPITRYGHSKLANALFAHKLATLYPSLTTTSHHPGTVKSEIWGKASDLKILALAMWPIVQLTGLTTDQGAETGLWTMFEDKGEVKNGGYYEPVGKLVEGPEARFGVGNVEALWEWTNKELEGHGAPGWPEA